VAEVCLFSSPLTGFFTYRNKKQLMEGLLDKVFGGYECSGGMTPILPTTTFSPTTTSRVPTAGPAFEGGCPGHGGGPGGPKKGGTKAAAPPARSAAAFARFVNWRTREVVPQIRIVGPRGPKFRSTFVGLPSFPSTWEGVVVYKGGKVSGAERNTAICAVWELKGGKNSGKARSSCTLSCDLRH